MEIVEGIDIGLSAQIHNQHYSRIKFNGAHIVQCVCHGAFMDKFTIEIKKNKIMACDSELLKIGSSLSKNVEVDLLVQKA